MWLLLITIKIGVLYEFKGDNYICAYYQQTLMFSGTFNEN